MGLVVTKQMGEVLFLQYVVGLVEAGHPVLHLYTDLAPAPDAEPTRDTVIGDVTECKAPGYAPITLVSSKWTVEQERGSTAASYPAQTFTFQTATSIQGYYVTDTSGHLLWIERLRGAPFEYPEDRGGAIKVQPTLSM